MRIRIGVDLDSTLNNLDEVWINRYNKDYNDNLTVDDMIDWDPTVYVKPECGKKFFDYLREPGFFANLGIRPDAKEVMEFLHNNFDVYIVTSAHPKVVGDKWDWVEKHLPFIIPSRFVPLHEKNLFKMDFLIDDGPHNIEAFDGTGILLDMPWNQNVEKVHIRVTRDNTWLQIKSLFQDFLDGKDRWAFRNHTLDRR